MNDENDNPHKWYHAIDRDADSSWFGPFNSREECVTDGIDLWRGYSFVVVHANMAVIDFQFDIMGVERHLEDAYEDSQAISEFIDHDYKLTMEKKEALVALLNEAVKTWVAKYPEVAVGSLFGETSEIERITPTEKPE